MQAILFAVVSYLGWGAGDVFATIAGRKIGPYAATFWFMLLSLITLLPFSVFFLADIHKITLEMILFILAIASIGDIGLVTFYEGLRVGSAPVVGVASSTFIAITILLSIIFLNETVTPTQAIAILIILAGTVITGLNFKGIKTRQFLNDKGFIYALVSAITWGVYWAFIKVPVVKIDWYWPTVIAFCSFPIVYAFMALRKIKLIPINSKQKFIPSFANALITGIGSLSYNFAISKGLTSLVIPIAGSYPTLFVILAYFAFKDPITKQQIAGIAITLIGIVLLSIFSA